LSATIKQPNAHQAFEIGNRLGDDGLRNCKSFRCLDHASLFDNCEQDVEMPQLETATDLLGPAHGPLHSKKL
jgi:hypothetical protein